MSSSPDPHSAGLEGIRYGWDSQDASSERDCIRKRARECKSVLFFSLLFLNVFKVSGATECAAGVGEESCLLAVMESLTFRLLRWPLSPWPFSAVNQRGMTEPLCQQPSAEGEIQPAQGVALR